MKSPLVPGLVLVLTLLLGAGCATRSERFSPGLKTVALALTVEGGTQPTAAQWLAVHQPLAKALAEQGWILVTDMSSAAHVIRVHLVPDPINPDLSGSATVIELRPNLNRGMAGNPRRGIYRPTYSSSGYSRGGWGHGSYHDRDYHDSSSSSRSERAVNPPSNNSRADHPRSDGGASLPRVPDLPMSSSSSSSHPEPSSSSSSGSGSSFSGSSGSSSDSGSDRGGVGSEDPNRLAH